MSRLCNNLRFPPIADAARDVIEDFGLGADLINLKAVDANTALAGDQKFKFVAAATTSVAANSISWYQDAANDRTIVQGDVNGDGIADFQIELAGFQTVVASDFVF